MFIKNIYSWNISCLNIFEACVQNKSLAEKQHGSELKVFKRLFPSIARLSLNAPLIAVHLFNECTKNIALVSHMSHNYVEVIEDKIYTSHCGLEFL